MSINKIFIKEFLALSKQHAVFDVRSPLEYQHAHIPNAISLPLFTDEERAVVGTLYKKQSREEAVKKGLAFFAPKMQSFISTVETYFKQVENKDPFQASQHTVLLYCWRGGMRSAALAWLLDLYGFKVYTLNGGYKAFRNWVLLSFKNPLQLNVLGGYTGSGKTEILNELEKHGESIIDLEKMASHKGSAFGHIGLPKQPSQEMFDNLLAMKLNQLQGKKIWVEDESQRIGLINLPNDFWLMLRKSTVYFIIIPFEERLQYIIEEYGVLNKTELASSITRIQKRLGYDNAKFAIDFLNENNIKECFAILLKYYDKAYTKSLHNRVGLENLLVEVNGEKVGRINAKLILEKAKK